MSALTKVSEANNEDDMLSAMLAELGGSDEIVLSADPEELTEVIETPALIVEASIEAVAPVEIEAAAPSEDDDLLAAMLDELAAPEAPATGLICETTLDAAVMSAEMQDAYGKEDSEEPLTDAVEPTEVKVTELPYKAPTKRKAAAPKEPKDPKEPKKAYRLDKVSRLTDGGSGMVLLKADAELTGDDLAAKEAEVIALIGTQGQKVQTRSTNILEFAGGKTAVLNNLIRVCFNLVLEDGYVSTSKTDNMYTTMRKCYGDGTINSGGMNSIAALKLMQVIVADGKGRYVENTESALFAVIKAKLGS